jgi:DNA-binding phage protein
VEGYPLAEEEGHFVFQPIRKHPAWLNRAIGLIAKGKTRKEAAHAVGVSRQTLHNAIKTLPDWSGVKVPAR